MTDLETNQRPHRSRKQRPCDRCRSRKTACILAGDGPCRSCDRAGQPCTFVETPRKRLRQQTSPGHTSGQQFRDDARQSQEVTDPQTTYDQFNADAGFTDGGDEGQRQNPYGVSDSRHTNPTFDTGHLSANRLDPSQNWTPRPTHATSMSPFAPYHNLNARALGDIAQDNTFAFMQPAPVDPGIQHVRSIETLDQFNVQLCGTSAELDPWLFRHCKFDGVGMRAYGKIRIRNVGGVPIDNMVPVHFTVVDDALYEPLGSLSSPTKSAEARHQELNALVSPELGLELISLYFKFVFPELPIVSRSRTDLLTSNDADGVSAVPVILLAAIYATAFPFCVHESSLQLSAAFDGAPVDALWNFVYELLVENIHRPKLAVLQAALLFVQRPPQGRTQALNDGPVMWSFWGSIVGLSNSLGLHLECRPWGIPAWEKRLRRRMWWAIYVEDTWRSFLSGRPPFIHGNEWDVSELDEADFLHIMAPAPGARRLPVSAASVDRDCIFPHVVRLTLLVSEVYQNFYTLKASQNLACNFRAAFDTAEPLRVKLRSWYLNLPEAFRIKTDSQSHQGLRRSTSRDGIAVLQFCYLIAEVLLYRAILRTMARSPPLAIITGGDDDEEYGEGEESIQSWINQMNWEEWFVNNYNLDQPPLTNDDDSGTALEATLNIAEKYGAIVTHFVKGLGHEDFDALWYGWIRLCLAAMSNFVTLLRVQAPDASRAAKAKSLWKLWLETLQRQYKHNGPLFMLALVRLNSWPSEDLDKFSIDPALVSPATRADTTYVSI